MRIYLGELELMDSKRIYVPPNEIVRIVLDDVPPALTLVLSTKDGDGERRVDKKLNGRSELELVFVNYHEPLGVFATNPTKLGTYNNRELFFSWGISFVSKEAGHELEILFFLGKEVKNEQPAVAGRS